MRNMSNKEIEKQYQNKRKAILQELKIEIDRGKGHDNTRVKELYKQLSDLMMWYVDKIKD